MFAWRAARGRAMSYDADAAAPWGCKLAPMPTQNFGGRQTCFRQKFLPVKEMQRRDTRSGKQNGLCTFRAKATPFCLWARQEGRFWVSIRSKDLIQPNMQPSQYAAWPSRLGCCRSPWNASVAGSRCPHLLAQKRKGQLPLRTAFMHGARLFCSNRLTLGPAQPH